MTIRPVRANLNVTPCPVCGAKPGTVHNDRAHDVLWLLPPERAGEVARILTGGNRG